LFQKHWKPIKFLSFLRIKIAAPITLKPKSDMHTEQVRN
jgi:hypothetical protein